MKKDNCTICIYLERFDSGEAYYCLVNPEFLYLDLVQSDLEVKVCEDFEDKHAHKFMEL